MESIEIKNFGPIRHVKLDLKDINVFIGTTASGKSTVAKLVAIARDFSVVTKIDFDLFIEHIIKYNIDFKITGKTYVKYCNGRFYWELKNKKINNNGSNWILATMVTISEQLLMLINRRKYPSNESGLRMQERVQTMLVATALLSGADELTKLEYEENSEELPEQARKLLSIVKEYRARLDMENGKDEANLSVINEFANDPRLLELVPLVGTDIFPDRTFYIPAERNLLSMVGESVFGLLSNNVSIAAAVKEFGSEFESARKQLKQLAVGFLNAEYKYADNANILALENGTEIRLEQASSGFQSIIPLLLVVEAKTEEKSVFGKYFIIEEPELNLYPTVQKELLEFVVERINKYQDKLIITTHSPYILTALDNLIQADNVVRQNSDAKEEVEKLVPSERWVDFDRVACYYFENGTCRSTLDEEQRSIGPSNIDDVSDTIGSIYDQLLAMKYDKVL